MFKGALWFAAQTLNILCYVLNILFLMFWLVHSTPVINSYSESPQMEMHCANCYRAEKRLQIPNRSGFNALSEWIIGIYRHEFTNNKREIQYRTRLCRVRYLKFRVNPDNSRVMSALAFLLFKLNTLHKETLRWNHYILGQPKPWCNDSGVLNVHHDNDVTTQYHVVQISQLENRNSYIWWNLNHAYSITRP